MGLMRLASAIRNRHASARARTMAAQVESMTMFRLSPCRLRTLGRRPRRLHLQNAALCLPCARHGPLALAQRVCIGVPQPDILVQRRGDTGIIPVDELIAGSLLTPRAGEPDPARLP